MHITEGICLPFDSRMVGTKTEKKEQEMEIGGDRAGICHLRFRLAGRGKDTWRKDREREKARTHHLLILCLHGMLKRKRKRGGPGVKNNLFRHINFKFKYAQEEKGEGDERIGQGKPSAWGVKREHFNSTDPKDVYASWAEKKKEEGGGES